MYSTSQKRGAGARTIDIKAQLATTHSSLFPLSSPNVDDRSSFQSKKSTHTDHSSDFTDFSPSTPSLTYGDERSTAGETEGRERWSRSPIQKYGIRTDSRMVNQQVEARKKPWPELQVVTDISQVQGRTGDIVFQQVPAKQPEQKRNRARSIVSQKGLRVLTSPITSKHPVQTMSDLKGFLNSKRDQTSEAKASSALKNSSKTKQRAKPAAPKGVMSSSQWTDHEASTPRLGDVHRMVTRLSPSTPKIVITSANEQSEDRQRLPQTRQQSRDAQVDSPSSLYSKSISQYYQTGIVRTIRPSAKASDQTPSEEKSVEPRLSSESQRQLWPDSGDTTRPQSQGWWNLMLSPILSRAGTVKDTRGGQKATVPPIPPIPSDVARYLPAQTPMTVMSPLTPRRQGLAGIRSSICSGSTEWEEDDRDLGDEDLSGLGLEDPVATRPKDMVHSVTSPPSLVVSSKSQSDGLAAEYYQACAVEQLTNVTYFECVNHSCTDRLPKLRSIYDVPARDLNPVVGVTHGDHRIQASKGSIPDSDLKHVQSEDCPSHASPGPVVQASVAAKEMSLSPGKGSDGESLRQMSLTTKRVSETPKSVIRTGPTTPILDEMDTADVVSPNIRQASAATFSRAKSINPRAPSPVPPLPMPAPAPAPKHLSIEPPAPIPHQPSVESPGPMSPEATRSIAPVEAMPMAPIHSAPAQSTVPLMAPTPQAPHALIAQGQLPPTLFYYPYGQPALHHFQAPLAQVIPMNYQIPAQATGDAGHADPGVATRSEQSQDLHHTSNVESRLTENVRIGDTNENSPVESDKPQEKSVEGKGNGKKWKTKLGALCSCFRRSKQKQNKRKVRRRTIAIAVLLLAIVVLCILFAIFFTRGNGSVSPIESRWLNLTGFPPMLTGISTIARPNLVASQNQCINVGTMWSCSVPKEDQASISPNDPDQPNFRFQIRFRNGTAGIPANMTIPLGKRATDSSTDDLFVPNPTPPSQQDQIFLGNTTDNITQPFDGEQTPFYITFMSASSNQSTVNNTKRLLVRQSDGNDLSNAIPPPSIGADGSALPASLLPTTPFPISQPIRLYNRGLPDEHYGFYMYYDKSIFLSSIFYSNGTFNTSQGDLAADENGGSDKQAANVRCTFSQTRFVVKMYTNPAFSAHLLTPLSTNNTSSNPKSDAASAATDFNRPGSFPYPTTILLDRHGGDINKKLVYCYGMNGGDIFSDQKTLFLEIRSFGGTIINPAPGLLASNSSTYNPGLGGIDGGTSGCGCAWQNWT